MPEELKRTYNPCDECPYGIEKRDGSGNDFMCKICEFADLVKASRRTQQPNEPLTLEQLRQMNGEPVWIALLNIAKQPTCEVITKICEDGIHTVGTEGSDYASFGLYGKTWLAYARKPEAGEKG